MQAIADDGPPRKRSRTEKQGPVECISLLSSDEEDETPSQNLNRDRHRSNGLLDVNGCATTLPTRAVKGEDPITNAIKKLAGAIASQPAFSDQQKPAETQTMPPHHYGSQPIPPAEVKIEGEDQRPPIPIREPPLCPEQRELVDIIMSGRNVFYTGSAGCGKSTALKAFTRRLKDKGLRVDIVAPTGISALGVGGSTTYVYAGWNISSFKLPLDDLRKRAHAKWIRKRLKDTDVLVIDEISMVENFHFERLNAVMQEARSSYEPFGGVQVVVTGDFHQLPPVKPFQYCLECGEELAENRSQESFHCKAHGTFHDEDKWAFKSKAWERCNFVYFHLQTIHRQNDQTFIKILQKCRVGEPLNGEDTDILVNHPSVTTNATKLYARREEVRMENRKRFDKLQSEKFSFPCLDEFHKKSDDQRFNHYGTLLPDGSLEKLRDHRFETLVEFKKGMLVVLLINLDLGAKLCNGSQGIICGYEDYDAAKMPKASNKKDLTQVNSIHGDFAELREWSVQDFIKRPEITKKVWPIVRFHNGVVRTIYADCSVHPLGNKSPYSLLCRTQIPLAPAWAMSIHKSQSLTLDRVIVDLTRAWEEGQVYVALSRATSLSGLKIEGDPKGLSVGKGGNTEVRKFHRIRFGI